MVQISNIFNGWFNLLTDNKAVDKLAKSRAKICFKCDYKKDNQIIDKFIGDDIIEIKGTICGICKCPLSAKIRSINEKCPKNLW